MRRDWSYKSLGDVCDVIGGGTPSKRNPEFYDGNIPWATVRDMRKEILSTTEFCISGEAIKNSSTKIIPKNNVVIATRVGLGKICFLKQDTAINQDLRGIIPKSKGLDVHFLFRWLQSIAIRIEEEGTGATVKGVKLPFIKSLRLPLPPFAEQKGIVGILDEAFEGIDTVVANTKKNLTNAREIFDSYLDRQFRDLRWNEHPINQHIKFIDYRGKTPEKTEEGVRLITAKNVRMGRLRREPEEYIHPEDYDSWMTRGFPKKGDVLFTTEAPLGYVCQLDTDEKVALAQRIITMQPDRDFMIPEYLSYVLRSRLVQSRIHEKATGATATGIKASLLKKILIPIAPLAEQKELVEKILFIESETLRLETIYQHKLSALTELKQSLLHKAFSGELTAKAAEAAVEEATA